MVFLEDDDVERGLLSAGAAANAFKFVMAARTMAKQAKQANQAIKAMNQSGEHSPSRSRRRRSKRGSATEKLKVAVQALGLISQTKTFALFSHRSSSAVSLQRSTNTGTGAETVAGISPNQGAGTGSGGDATAEPHAEEHAKVVSFSASENEKSNSESGAAVYVNVAPPPPKVNMMVDDALGVAQSSHASPKSRQQSRKRFAGHAPPTPTKRPTVESEPTFLIDAAINHAASARKTRAYNKQTTLGRIMRTAWKEEASSKTGGASSGGGTDSSGGGGSSSNRASVEEGSSSMPKRRRWKFSGTLMPPFRGRRTSMSSENSSASSGRRTDVDVAIDTATIIISDRASVEEGSSSVSKRSRWRIRMSPFRSRGTSISSENSSASSGRRTDLNVAIDTTSASMAPPPPPETEPRIDAPLPPSSQDEQKAQKKDVHFMNEPDLDVESEPTLPPGVVSVDRNTRGFGTLNVHARGRPKLGHHEVHAYESLVFKGGGAKGAIYPGAVQALEDVGVMPYIKRFAGASAGAVTAALLASGLTAKQLFRELANTDLFGLIKDGDSAGAQLYTLVTKCGMNPGNALYRYLGLLFYKYLGNADVTFLQLYEAFGVELAICVTNVTRASSELLHVKTSPNYPIRKAVRISMSLPIIIQPCRENNPHGLVHDVEDLYDDVEEMNLELSLQRQRVAQRRKVVKDLQRRQVASAAAGLEAVGQSDAAAAGSDVGADPLDLFVDGGVLNNYPIDAFDGWWLSMKPEDAFHRRLIGTGGHAAFINRFEGCNASTLGFRLTAAAEPDSMHSRLGNDKLELKVREMPSASLPQTTRSEEYSKKRELLTQQAKHRVQVDEDLRATMDWLKGLYLIWEPVPQGMQPHALIAEIVACNGNLERILEQVDPPKELLRAFSLGSIADLAAMLRPLHDSVIKGKSHLLLATAALPVPDGALSHLDSRSKKLLDEFRMIIFEVEKIVERLGETSMAKLFGTDPVDCPSLEKFFLRLIESIQISNDERVQTKGNMKRTCVLDTEYVGVVDFKLEEEDFGFLWRKGYVTTRAWLDKRIDKRNVVKKAANDPSTAAGLVSRESMTQAAAVDAKPSAPSNSKKSWIQATQAAFWAAAERKKAERDAALRAEAAESELVQNMSDELHLKDELLRSKEQQLEDAHRRVQALEEQLKAIGTQTHTTTHTTFSYA
jgi:predicted acylesterase/phospholipase RssA